MYITEQALTLLKRHSWVYQQGNCVIFGHYLFSSLDNHIFLRKPATTLNVWLKDQSLTNDALYIFRFR